MRLCVSFFIVILILSCGRNKNSSPKSNSPNVSLNAFEVKEVIQTSKYTYLRVKENVGEKWVAVAKQEALIGDYYYYNGALQMNNFYSKELERTFENIFFISEISKTPIGQKTIGTMPAHSGSVDVAPNNTIDLKKSENEITIERIFSNKTDYSQKEIEIRGIVMKVNNGVMDKNWIHIQDGTKFNDKFDLTVTSQDLTEIGDEVTFKGKIILEKNFGSGYFYDVIMEDANLVNKRRNQK